MNTFRYGDLIRDEPLNSGIGWTGMILGPSSTYVDIHGHSYLLVLVLRDDDADWEVGSVHAVIAAEAAELLVGRVTV